MQGGTSLVLDLLEPPPVLDVLGSPGADQPTPLPVDNPPSEAKGVVTGTQVGECRTKNNPPGSIRRGRPQAWGFPSGGRGRSVQGSRRKEEPMARSAKV